MMFDYETLRFIWWVLIAVLLLGYAIMDGFDLGVGTLLPFVARTDDERRVLINAIGPTWDGNQVWLVLGLGAIFAAWPAVYAAAFSGMYAAMLLMLFALFLRPIGFDYRSKIASPLWRSFWDYALFFGGMVPAVVMGIAFGNLLQGVPFHFDENFRSFYTGTMAELLNPFALLAGLVSLSMLVMHGAAFLLIKTEGVLQLRARNASRGAAIVTVLLFIVAGVWLMTNIEGFRLVGEVNHFAGSKPFGLHVVHETGAWMRNFYDYPWMWLAPFAGVVGAMMVIMFGTRKPGMSWISSSVSVAGIAATAGLAMFPFVLPSSTHPAQSLLMWNATSSEQTLWLMFIAAAIFIPLIVAYTSWVFRVLRGKVTVEQIKEQQHTAY
jgi:cytochrome d ubiquinol oxidase subunit II